MNAVRMTTDELVASLVSELTPVSRSAVALRLAIGATVGAAISMLLLIGLLGARPDLAAVLQSVRFWSKAGYMIAVAGASLFVASRLARPDSQQSVMWVLALPLLGFLPFVLVELATTTPSDWAPLLLGHGWQLCTWLVLLLSVPIYVGLWWAFRSFAPRDVEAAGAITGLSASALAGIVYCLHCPSDTAVFAFVWYTLAFAIALTLGRLLGRRFLRW